MAHQATVNTSDGDLRNKPLQLRWQSRRQAKML